MKLWPHQTRAIEMARSEAKRGNKWVVIVVPTGGGKTHLATAMTKTAVERGRRVLFVAHREELVEQAFDTIHEAGIPVGAIQACATRPCNPFLAAQVGSIQTLIARGLTPEADLLIFDECHHAASDTWSAIPAHYRAAGAFGVGLTATPVRGDGRGLEGTYDAIVEPTSMRELITAGFLVPYVLVGPERPLRPGQIAQSPVKAYQAHAPGRQAICFAGNVKAAEKFVGEFNDAGTQADIVTGDMPGDKRRSVLEAYKARRITVLVNVQVLTEGFDDRPTSCVILARGVGSVSLYLQMVGRGLRTSPGKTDCILIDLHGSSGAFGEPAEDREYSLEGEPMKRKLEVAKERFCAVCGVLVVGMAYVCVECGIARPELCAPDVMDVKLVKYAAKRRESPEVQRAYFEKLKAIARAAGHSPWAPVMKFAAIYGQKPPVAWMH